MLTIFELLAKAANMRDTGQRDHEAIVMYTLCRERALRENEKHIAALCLHEIGLVYQHMNDFTSAKSFMRKARREAKRNGDTLLVGITYFDESDIVRSEKNLKNARRILLKSAKILLSTTDRPRQGMICVKLGEYEFYATMSADSETKALRHIKKGLDYIQRGISFLDPNSYFMANALRKLALLTFDLDERLAIIERAEVILGNIEEQEKKHFTEERRKLSDLK